MTKPFSDNFSCPRFSEQLFVDYFLQQLPPEAMESLDSHILTCQVCGAALQGWGWFIFNYTQALQTLSLQQQADPLTAPLSCPEASRWTLETFLNFWFLELSGADHRALADHFWHCSVCQNQFLLLAKANILKLRTVERDYHEKLRVKLMGLKERLIVIEQDITQTHHKLSTITPTTAAAEQEAYTLIAELENSLNIVKEFQRGIKELNHQIGRTMQVLNSLFFVMQTPANIPRLKPPAALASTPTPSNASVMQQLNQFSWRDCLLLSLFLAIAINLLFIGYRLLATLAG
jgi:hypothetical protein